MRLPIAPLAAATACGLLAAGYAALQHWAPGRPAPLPYDAVAAMDAAGRAAPPEVQDFAFFVFDAQEPEAQDIPSLAAQLLASASAREHLGITGPDPLRNRAALLGALAAQRARLEGATIIYLGPLEQRAELSLRVQGSGAQFIFVEFPAPAQSI